MSSVVPVPGELSAEELDEALRHTAAEMGIPAATIEAALTQPVDPPPGQEQEEGALPVWSTLTVMQESPRLYARVAVDKNSKGWNTESTVSVDGARTHEELVANLRQLLHETDELIREEIARRESADAEYRTGPVGRFEVGGGSE